MRLGEHGKEIWGSEDTYVYSNNSGWSNRLINSNIFHSCRWIFRPTCSNRVREIGFAQLFWAQGHICTYLILTVFWRFLLLSGTSLISRGELCSPIMTHQSSTSSCQAIPNKTAKSSTSSRNSVQSMNEVRHGSNRWLAYCFPNRCSTRSSWTIALNSLKSSYIASKLGIRELYYY